MLKNTIKLPNCVRGFMAELSDYIRSDPVYDEYLKTNQAFSVEGGKARINLKSAIMLNPTNYNQFISDFETAKLKWHVLSSYTTIVFHVKSMSIEDVPEGFRDKKNCWRKAFISKLP